MLQNMADTTNNEIKRKREDKAAQQEIAPSEATDKLVLAANILKTCLNGALSGLIKLLGLPANTKMDALIGVRMRTQGQLRFLAEASDCWKGAIGATGRPSLFSQFVTLSHGLVSSLNPNPGCHQQRSTCAL